MNTLKLPSHVLEVMNKLSSGGHDAFLVGGSVRDSIIGADVKDWDVATSATPVEVANLFSKTVLTGEKFGTVTAVLPEGSIEITTFRTDGTYTNGRHPESVTFASDISEDLSRRDFTINAMAMSASGELIDPFGGTKDIKSGIIRCVGGPNTRFAEDALRMFRAFRFSAVLGFEIEPETLQAIYANIHLANQISIERTRVELEKIIMSQRPEILGEMIKIGLLERHTDILGRSPQGLDKISILPEESLLRWTAFCAILLETKTIRSATEWLYTLRFSSKTTKTCLNAVRIRSYEETYALSSVRSNKALFYNKIEIKKLLAENERAAVRCAAAISDVLNLAGDGRALANTDEVISSGECATLGELAISGKDLLEAGHPPGLKLGETLKKLLMFVIENPQTNQREVLVNLINSINP